MDSGPLSGSPSRRFNIRREEPYSSLLLMVLPRGEF